MQYEIIVSNDCGKIVWASAPWSILTEDMLATKKELLSRAFPGFDTAIIKWQEAGDNDVV